jgi:hypothetical protein
LSNELLSKVFPHSPGCLVILIIVFFAMQRHFDLIQCHFSVLSLISWAFGALFTKSFPMPVSSSALLMSSFSFFQNFRSYAEIFPPFWIYFLYSERQGTVFSFPPVTAQFSQHCWKDYLFSNMFLVLLSKIR